MSCIFKDSPSLCDGNTGKAFNKLVNRNIVFEVFKKSGNRNPCAAKQPSTTNAIRVALYGRTGRPINHAANCTLEMDGQC